MATILRHRKVNIVTLEAGEALTEHCRPGDIAIVPTGNGWWTYFIGEDGSSETYDEPFDSYNKALWTAKAAAEFDSE